ncbi:MAG: hypothetical protein ACI9VS_004413 [Candidatus Binatia bacterium]|jgi:hypothetical protein
MKTNKSVSTFLAALVAAAALLVTTVSVQAAPKTKSLRVLLITGGCCHDYAAQKDILKKGLEARAHVVVDQIHTDDKSTTPPLAIYGNPDYAKGYDVVIHDECAAGMADAKIVAGVLAPHRNGTPGVNLHCAMHSFRVGNHREPTEAGSEASMWFDYLGLQSSSHGPRSPVDIAFSKTKHPITKTLGDWKTVNEELYNNVQIFPGTTSLAIGTQMQMPRQKKNRKKKAADAKPAEKPKAKLAVATVAWVNEYHGSRVFSTTIGHVNETVADDRYLDLVTRGLLWSCKKLNKDYLK